jgi:hypothetical protein
MSLNQFCSIELGNTIEAAECTNAVLVALARLDAIPAVGADIHCRQLAESVPI